MPGHGRRRHVGSPDGRSAPARRISSKLVLGYPAREKAEMAKTLIDVDEEYLAAAQQALKTETKKDTVNGALRAVAAMAARRRDLQRLVSGGLPDLGDVEVMRAAWQR
jgi:Arc/MetJ family transcription regulator